MCGEHPVNTGGQSGFQGSSPHVRGAHCIFHYSFPPSGIIPACAGSTSSHTIRDTNAGDHPRMCGEHAVAFDAVDAGLGSSPHVRGALWAYSNGQNGDGIIPACAGSTGGLSEVGWFTGDHPRMCGEHDVSQLTSDVATGSSPHVRGAHFENSIIPRKRKDNWLFFIQFRFENFLAFRYLLALLHPFLGVPTKDPSFASLGRLINCNPSQSTGDQSAPYTLKAICCSFLAE